LYASASPTLSHKVLESTQDIPSIRNPSESYFDFWKRWTQVGALYIAATTF
jgi:hypothetical protein